MGFKNKLMGSGLSALAAGNIQGGGRIGLIGLGTTQATALLITADLNVFSSVPSGTGAVIPGVPAMMQGDSMWIVNNDASNALLVYPPAGGTINALSANAGFSLAANKMMLIMQTGATNYQTILTA